MGQRKDVGADEVRRGPLFTIQDYDLRSFSGPITLQQGTYKNEPDISAAQQKLYTLIGESQVIWCQQDFPDLCGATGRYLHKVEIDSRDVVAIVDGLIWNHIIGSGPRYIPPDDHAKLRYQARASRQDYDIALRKLEDDYLAEHLPDDLWSTVTKPRIDRTSDQVLVRFPFVYSRILSVEKITWALAGAEPQRSEQITRCHRGVDPIQADIGGVKDDI